MSNRVIKDRVLPATPGTPAGDSPQADARTLAEQKAEAAGRKQRAAAEAQGEKPEEFGGPSGLEPTRYGDWERAGRCIDF